MSAPKMDDLEAASVRIVVETLKDFSWMNSNASSDGLLKS
jgi:hypothetical protein